MAILITRRSFVAGLSATVLAGPLATRAQQPATAVIGFLNSGGALGQDRRVAAYRRGLREAGFEEGKNVAIEYRWANGQYDRLPAMAADLVAHRVDVIAAGGPPAARAAKAATATTPIVFTTGDDPVLAGLVPSINRPGGNVTGVHLFLTNLGAKNLGFLHDLLPQAGVFAAMVNLASPSGEIQARNLEASARALGVEILITNASNESEIETAFATLAPQKVGALIVGSDPYYLARRDQIIALAARYALPATYELREYVDAGGLMSYGTDIDDGYREAAIYAGRILKGEKPADLPVLQSTKFQFVLNLKTAKALGIKISDNLLTLADEVIE